MIDQGEGPLLVLIPGIQGRCEWMQPLVRALAPRHRVLSFSLNGVNGTSFFTQWSDRVDGLLTERRAERADIVGVSFGGLVALHHAARRPAMTGSLVLVSTPSPRWPLDPESSGYLHRPWRAFPRFVARAGRRLWPEIHAAHPTVRGRARFSAEHLARALRFPQSPRRMASWVREWMSSDLTAACGRVNAPTLLITGEPELDRVVPVASSLDYLSLLPTARHATLTRTGHLGFLLDPTGMADLIHTFVSDPGRARAGGARRS